jgi:uncharacterized protein (TIGR02421 family)
VSTQVAAPSTVYERVAAAATEHVKADRQLRRNLPGEGRLYLDRALPFLVVYRQPVGRLDAGTADLAAALSTYLLASGDERFQEGLSELVKAIADAAHARHGGFLLIELWSTPQGDAKSVAPGATVVAGPGAHAHTVDALATALREMVLRAELGGDLGVAEQLSSVDVRTADSDSPPDLPALLEAAPASKLYRLGIELTPFYRDPASGSTYPRVVQALRRSLAAAVEHALFVFSEEETSLDPPHARSLSRATAERASLHVDRRLSEVFGAFDTLLQVTPVNTEEAWEAFRSGGFQAAPTLRYPPLPFDPESLKRRLFHVPIERVESPLLAYLFREKLEELDRQITMVSGLGTERFFHASAELYGTPDEALVALARQILERLPPRKMVGVREDYTETPEAERDQEHYVDAEGFTRLARAEIDRYRRQLPDFLATVEIRPGVAAGLMVSKSILLVSDNLRIPRERVEALISHEIGTHLVTYFNGAAQPLRIFASGLAGYDPLQEGIAVLAEHLVGGLNVARMRVLAGRVLAVRTLVEGAEFPETFRVLHKDLGFEPRTAFITTLRVHRGGGLTKDAAYLEGLRDLLGHLRKSGSVDPLLIGKVGLAHSEIVQELVLTGVLRLPVVRPHYTSDLAAMERLGACRRMDVLDLVEALRP